MQKQTKIKMNDIDSPMLGDDVPKVSKLGRGGGIKLSPLPPPISGAGHRLAMLWRLDRHERPCQAVRLTNIQAACAETQVVCRHFLCDCPADCIRHGYFTRRIGHQSIIVLVVATCSSVL